MVREPLRARRHNETLTIQSADGAHILEVSIGFYPDGRPGEVFIVGGEKEGSLLRMLLADAAVLISIALQHGATAQEMVGTLLREPTGDAKDGITRPASPLGAVLEILANKEKP